jgi:FkbM family methyltransferase
MNKVSYYLLDLIFYKLPFTREAMVNIVNSYLHNNKPVLKSFLTNHKDFIMNEIENSPSILKNERHIKKVVELVSLFNLQKNDSIIDIGSAFGNVGIYFATAFPMSKVYCFEPIKESFDKLLENTQPYSNIIPFNIAIGNPVGEFEEAIMHITHNFYSSSILNIDNSNSNEYLSSAMKEVKTENVKVASLDTMLQNNKDYFNIMKIDVQGYELEVLKGAKKTLKSTKIILLEMQNHENYISAPSYHEIDLFLRESGFNLFDIIPSIYNNRRLYEWDAIYVNKNS